MTILCPHTINAFKIHSKMYWVYQAGTVKEGIIIKIVATFGVTAVNGCEVTYTLQLTEGGLIHNLRADQLYADPAAAFTKIEDADER